MDNNASLYRFLLYILLSIGIVSAASTKLDMVTAQISNQFKEYHTKKDMTLIKDHLAKFQEENHKYPPAHRFSHWYVKNLKKDMPFAFPLDRWGEPYIYKTDEMRMNFTLISKGKDKKLQTKDDLIVISTKP